LTCEIIYTLSYIESLLDFHFGLRDLKWCGTNQPVGGFLSTFEERNKSKELGEGERMKEAIGHKTF
jgi:hypothetical protein